MEIESFNTDIERRILIGMITDDVVASSVSASWDVQDHNGLFRTDLANMIGKWCVTHHTKYGVAPRESILSRFQVFQDKNTNRELSQRIGDLLSSLDFESDRNPIQNRDYLIDQASRYFTEVRLERIADRIKAGIQTGKLDDSINAVNSFQKIELGADLGIDPLRNESAIRQAFESASEQLIHFNRRDEDDMAHFFGDSFSRDSLIGFLAAEKSGKCVAGDSLVLFADGLSMAIRDVVKTRCDKKVISFDETTQSFVESTIADYWDNGEKACVCVTMKSGRKITTTLNHQYLTPNGWKSLDSIKTGEFIAVPKRIEFFGNVNGTDELIDQVLQSPILWDEVVSITDAGILDTYDLTIDKHHNFIADNCIVHNSMMLLDIAWRAVREKHKVAFFEVGDMSQNQVMLRLMAHITGIPKKHGRYKYPTSLRVDRKHNVEISHDERKIKEGEELSADDAISECRKLLKKHGDNEFFRLSVHPNNSIGVLGIESRLEMWERSGWMPDVIVIDYADLLIPPNTRQEKRYQVDETWKQLRGLSQSRHCLVVTATQADAASYRAKILDKSNFSESKTKLAHVTGMIGINASQSDRDKYIRRLNWIVRREAEYNELECLYIAGCLAMCRPMILGFLLTVH